MIDLLKGILIHSDWDEFLTPVRVQEIRRIESILVKELPFTPNPEKVLRFLSVPLQPMQVVILGQDPYPQPGIASGRAFEVENLNDWHQTFRNISLQNIIRAVVKAEYGILYKFNEIRRKLGSEIRLLPPDSLFEDWERQGVLLLNTSFTCQLNLPNSHTLLWQDFTKELLSFINRSRADLCWFLWGEHARKSVLHLENIKSIYRYHPSRCYPRANDFLYSDSTCFEESGLSICWTGIGLPLSFSE